MARIAEPRDYWIAPEAIYITRNALGDPDRIQGNVAAGAAILCYMKGVQGLEYDNGHNYKSWPLSLSPTYFNTTTPKYIYVAIPKTTQVGTQGVVVFPSQKLDVYGMTEPTVDPETEEEIPGEQIGSTDYYYIWLQGILSASVDELGATQEREWLQEIQTGLLSSDEALASLDTDWYSYSQITSVVTFLKEIAMSAGAWFRNLIVGSGTTQGNLTGVATGANGSAIEDSSSQHIVTPSYLNNKFLRKDIPDTAKEKITFEKGAEFGDFVKDATGAALYQDDDRNWHFEADFLHVRKKLTAKEVQIEEVTHIGGQQLLTAAQMLCAFVVDKGDYYRCFFNKEASDGRKVTNKWKTGDQAYACTFNIEKQADDTLGNHYFWRLVTGTSNDGADTSDYEVDGETVNGSAYHYIDLSKTTASSDSDAPKAGDNIVQLGYRGTDAGASERQAAILMAGAGEASPYIREFTGINTFSLPAPETQLKPGDNILTGVVNMSAGSTLGGENLQNVIDHAAANASSAVRNELSQTIEQMSEDVSQDISNIDQSVVNIGKEVDGLNGDVEQLTDDVNNLTTGNENLLRNSGFTGDYIDEEVAAATAVDADTPMYSDPLAHWTATNAEVISTTASVTGKAVRLSAGSLQQTLEKPLVAGSHYVFSFRAFGSQLKFSVGGHSQSVVLTSANVRYNVRFTASSAGTTFAITETSATVMELQLVEGVVPNTDWINNPNDNDKALAYYQSLTYLANAIVNASTQVLGGLVLSQLFKVGNYRNGKMTEETGGMSGFFNSPESPFLWGGGSMEKAFYTIAKYAENPLYQATDDEVKSLMAQFVVTHGGRAILNDIIARGFIIATSGIFKNILTPNGNFRIDEQGNMSCQNATISGNMYAPFTRITRDNYQIYGELLSDGGYTQYNVNLVAAGFNIQIAEEIAKDLVISLPTDDKYYGALARIVNTSNANLYVRNIYATSVGAAGDYYSETPIRWNQVIVPNRRMLVFQCLSLSSSWNVVVTNGAVNDTQPRKIATVQAGDVLKISAGRTNGNKNYAIYGGTENAVNTSIVIVSETTYRVVGMVYTVPSNCTAIYAQSGGGEIQVSIYKHVSSSPYQGWVNVSVSGMDSNIDEAKETWRSENQLGVFVGNAPYIDGNGILRFADWYRTGDDGKIIHNK